MPDAPKTPHRTIRIPDEVWDAAKAKAEREGTTISEVVRTYLARWAKR